MLLDHLVNGYKELYSKSILHRDIKPDNYVIKDSLIKLTDFGFSKYDNGTTFTFAGTPKYMAPEV